MKGLGINFYGVLFDVMNNNEVRLDHISLVMWNLNGLTRLGAMPVTNEDQANMRFMLKAALSINNADVLDDTLPAFRQYVEHCDDESALKLYTEDVIIRLLSLLNMCAIFEPSGAYRIN